MPCVYSTRNSVVTVPSIILKLYSTVYRDVYICHLWFVLLLLSVRTEIKMGFPERICTFSSLPPPSVMVVCCQSRCQR
jgi:hypothetical protein